MSVTNLIKQHEGLRLKAYSCPAGKITVGYGRNLEDKGLSEVEADYLLINDISEIEASLSSRLYWFMKLGAVRRAVLIDMAYNLGINGLLSFKRTLAHIEKGDYEAAAIEMLDSRWADQVGQRADRLSEMMLTGEWPEDA